MRLSKFTLVPDNSANQDTDALIAGFNATARPYPRDRSIAALFAIQAATTPDAVAVSQDGKTLTYAALDRQANRLANHLAARLPTLTGRLVAIALDRSPEMIVAMLAILKTGAAYLPLDPAYPAARRALMLGHSGAVAIVTRADVLDEPDVPRICLDSERMAIAIRNDTAPPASDCGGALAYVMYTSGSTGKPKAVAIPHRAVVRLVRNTDYAEFSADHVFLQYAPTAFDAATFEIWGPLLNGARLAIAPRGQLGLEELGGVIEREGVTTLWLTGGLFNVMIDSHPDGLRPLRQLLVGGEALSVAHVQKALALLPGCRLINGYGPTENTTFSCCYPIEPGEYRGSIPIGRPIANSTAYILDDQRRPLPPGAVGELYLGGDGLALGYWNDPTLTAERFVANPFAEGEKLYRSGDLASWRADGTIEFLGRADDQIKLRGFRIEPGEIEAALMQHPQVTGAVVMAREVAQDCRDLVAYIAAPATIDLGDLRARLATTLSEYMVPARIVRLDRLPLTVNGKIDRTALPAPETDPEDRILAAPDGETETALLGFWQRLLERDAIGVTDDFFALGGHSLIAAKLVSVIGKELGVSLPLASVFTHPTIRQQAHALMDTVSFDIDAIDHPRVLMNAPRQGRAIFALPPGTTDALSYARLAAELDGFDVHAFNFIEEETRIADYADLIAEVQPSGTLLLLGYSGGGNLAFHVAQELERRGRRVGDIVMLDATRLLRPYPFPEAEADRLAESFLSNESVAAVVKTGLLRDKARRRMRRYYACLSTLVQDRPVGANIHLIRSSSTSDSHHTPDGTLVGSQTGWAEVTRGSFDLREGAGGHGEMLTEPHFSANLDLLREVLASTTVLEGAPA